VRNRDRNRLSVTAQAQRLNFQTSRWAAL
jgi:hypothetical protein